MAQSFCSLLLGIAGCGASVAPEEPKPMLAHGADAGASSRTHDAGENHSPPSVALPTQSDESFCTVPPPVELSGHECHREVAVVEAHARGCLWVGLSGDLRFPCEGGAARLELGDVTLYGFVYDDQVSLCGGRDFTLDEVCSDGTQRMRGTLSVLGPLEGPLSLSWRASSLSSDLQCQHASCYGAGIAHVHSGT